MQRNALSTWRSLSPPCEVLLLGAADGVAALAADAGTRHIPDIAYTPHGAPRLDDVVARAERHASYDILCYVNADILLPPTLPRVVALVARRWSAFLVTGQRWDWEVDGPLRLADDGWTALERRVRRTARRRGPAAADYFVFRRGLWPAMPPFALGRTAWDNWLIYGARAAGVPVVDATHAVFCVHQTHPYDHVPGGAEEVLNGEDARRNRRLTDGGRHAYTLEDATWLVVGDRLIPALAPKRLGRRWRHVRRHDPRIRRLRHGLGRWPVLRRWALPAEAAAPVPHPGMSEGSI